MSMSMIEVIKKWLKISSLRRLERGVLDCVQKELPYVMGQRFLAQVNSISKVQRFSEGKEVNLYWCAKNWARGESDPGFSNRIHADHLLAQVVLYRTGKEKKIRSRVWVVDGRLISITYSDVPKGHSKEFNVSDVKIFDDIDIELTQTVCSGRKYLREYFFRWDKDLNFLQILPPLPEVVRNKRMAAFDTFFPKDYCSLINHTEGFRVNEWKVYGVSGIREIVTRSKNYFVIAEGESAAIAVAEGNCQEELYLLDFESDDEDFRAIGNSFCKNLVALCNPPVNLSDPKVEAAV